MRREARAGGRRGRGAGGVVSASRIRCRWLVPGEAAGDVGAAIEREIARGWFGLGAEVSAIEEEFAAASGGAHAVGVGTGTDAIALIFRALGIGAGDEVITAPLSAAYSALAIMMAGARPVFADVDPERATLDPDRIAERIGPRTRAIMPVHLYGRMVQMAPIMELAKARGLHVIEDACQAHGAIFQNKRVGSFGTLSAFSFYPGKNLGAYGDGGAITTSSQHLAERIRKIREYGGEKYYYDEIGLNSRLDSLQASILSIKLKHLEDWNKKRRQAALYYTKQLNKILPRIVTPTEIENVLSVYHLYVIQVDRRDELLKYLNSKGVSTGIHYPIPLHFQKSLQSLGYKKGDFAFAEKTCARILSLPIYPEITQAQQNFVIQSIKRFYEEP